MISSIVTLHDVMPGRWDEVRRTLDFLADRAVSPVTLLVVPGGSWSAGQLDELRGYARTGFPLAGHGWTHAAERWGGLYHRLHGLVLSRRAAEHLALSRVQITDLIGRCHAWFAARDLPAPDLYVPPAWAMGPVRRRDLAALPFRYYEDLHGVLDVERDRYHRLPLLGYEADAGWRVPALAFSNALNRLRARAARRPVRIAVHPGDVALPLARHLDAALRASTGFVDHRALGAPGDRSARTA